MLDSETLVLWTFILVGGLLYAWYRRYRLRDRREQMRRFARSMGYRLSAHEDEHFHERFGHSVFSWGDRRQAYNLLQGGLRASGLELMVTVGDYSFTTGVKTRETHDLSFLLVHLPFPLMPDLVIQYERLRDRLATALGFDDIDFESAEFSHKFYVQASDRRFAYDVVHPRMMEFLLETPAPLVELKDGVCLLWRGLDEWGFNSWWEPDEFRQYLEWAQRFFELWPEHLLAELKTRQEA